MKSIHISIAKKILDGGSPCNLKVWRIGESNRGEILCYNNAICISRHERTGRCNIKLLDSGEIRKFYLVTLFSLNDMEVYL